MEEPRAILSSNDLKFLILVFADKYSIFSLEKDSLTCKGIFYFKTKDVYIYEDFILTFITDRGFYFQILADEVFYPVKILKFSDEMNSIHIKLSKKLKEKTINYTKK